MKTYRGFADELGFASVATAEQVLANGGNLSIRRYVRLVSAPVAEDDADDGLRLAWADFDAGSSEFWQQMEDVVDMLDRVAANTPSDG